jgi:hypothetical protein
MIEHIKLLAKEKGWKYVFQMAGRWIKIWTTSPLIYWYYKNFPSYFEFQGETYPYFYAMHHTTWKNERCVEIPIVQRYVDAYEGKHILEVGNVMSHYFAINYDIVDKYEKAKGVMNEDVVDFKTLKRYDLIVSISTLEHVGWDETPKDAMKTLQAIENLKGLLAPKGKMIVTLPIGYNSNMDNLIKEGKILFTKEYYLKRIAMDKWREATWEEVNDAKYNEPFPKSNGLMIGVFENR